MENPHAVSCLMADNRFCNQTTRGARNPFTTVGMTFQGHSALSPQEQRVLHKPPPNRPERPNPPAELGARGRFHLPPTHGAPPLQTAAKDTAR